LGEVLGATKNRGKGRRWREKEKTYHGKKKGSTAFSGCSLNREKGRKGGVRANRGKTGGFRQKSGCKKRKERDVRKKGNARWGKGVHREKKGKKGPRI